MKKRVREFYKNLCFLLCSGTALSQAYINELVVDPQMDRTGDGKITSSDEYVEIYFERDLPVNIDGWRLELIDTTPETIYLKGEVNQKYFIIANPRGEQNNNGRIELYDGLGNLVDAVTYGNWDDGSGQLSPVPNGNASSLTNEALARCPDGSTNWIKTFSSMGFSNCTTNSNSPRLGIYKLPKNKVKIIGEGISGKRQVLESVGSLEKEGLEKVWQKEYTNEIAKPFEYEEFATNISKFYRLVDEN